MNPSPYLATMTALALLTTHDAAQANELNRAFARASLGRAKEKSFVDPAHYRDAARVMGRTLSPETQARLSAICTANFSDLPEPVLQWLEQLASDIIA